MMMLIIIIIIIFIIILAFTWYIYFSEITDYQADYINLALLESTGSIMAIS
jgi:hypothetical protein